MKFLSVFLLVIIFLFAGPLSHAASPQPAWAPHVMVSSADSLATEVGLDILRQGGNAVDAAAAVALALGVTEGYSSGIGGGCFILIRMADGTSVCIDGRETAPALATRKMYVPRDTTQASTLSTEGVLAAATPGELAALDLAVRTYGRLPFAAAFNGAVALADTGFIVNRRYARSLNSNADLLGRFPGTKAVFFRNGVPLRFQDRLVQTDLANTLRRVQTGGIEAFYTGDVPRIVEEHMKANGGILSKKDFAGYQPLTREPVRGDYKGYQVLSMPPPSSGGVHLIQILNLLEPFDLKYWGAGSSEVVHIIAEAMQIAFADRAALLGDPVFVKVPAAGLISKDYADAQRSRINRLTHEPLPGAGNPWAYSLEADSLPPLKHTTHLCVVDSFGNAVSLTATVNTPFGSGVIVPGLGFLLNNEMDDFVTWPGKPNYFGLVGNEANEIQPGKRPLSSMSPTILLRDGKPFIIAGSMGGPRIITSVVLALINMLDFGMTSQEAMDFPRIHQQWMPDVLYMEPEYPFDVLSALRAKGHTIRQQNRWAAATAIMADTARSGWWGASDSRVNGFAKGF
ncbi:gamma-glutamyltransferase [candidate division KSB1 bacterium]|nr:MAG: gamma-glutamyltransferase [candidate division KSB1 bacterium]